MRALTCRSAATAVAGVLVLTGAAACGSSKKTSTSPNNTSSGAKASAKADPQKAFTDAIAKLSTAQGGAITVKFDATEAQISAYMTAVEKAKSKPADPQDAQIAKYLGNGSVTIDSVGKSASFAVNLNGSPIVQFVGSEAGDVYFRADVPTIAKLAGPKTEAEVSQASGSLPAGFEFVKDAIAGKWLEIDGAALKQIESLATAQAGASAVPSIAPGEAKALESKLATALGADFTATDAGSDPKGEHLVLTGNLKKLVADLLTVAQGVPGASTALTKVDTTTVPDKDVTIDAYVGDDGLAALDLNVAQFSPDPTVKALSFPLEVSFAKAPSSITLPTDATKVDVSKLLSSLGSLGLGSKV